MDKAEAFYRCAPVLNAIYHKADWIWWLAINDIDHSRATTFPDGDAQKALNELAAALLKMPELETDVFSRFASLVTEAQSSEFAGLETWFDCFDVTLYDYFRFVDETAAQLFGKWGAAFFLMYVEDRTFDEAERFSRQYSGELLGKRFSRRRRFKDAHIIWYARHVDGKLSHQQVRDRHQDRSGEELSRDAVVKAIGRIRRALRVA